MTPTRSATRPFATGALALALSVALGGAAFAPAPAQAKTPAASTVDIPYETFTLPNGLRVVVHTDRKAPIVAVNLWYHVGSKDEPSGRSGFAHLFEHLMFNGSENHKGDFFPPLETVGATDLNGTTNTDRTNYFENVPTTALDTALWMESDRMGHLLGAIDQATLDEQRGVVQNEKRQGQNQPYGQVWEVLQKTMYPAGHPYHHTTIGSMNDLDAAKLDDVKTWFRTWYGPNNAVLVLAGDIDVATAKQKAAEVLRRHPGQPDDGAAEGRSGQAHADHARDDGRQGAADAHLSRLERRRSTARPTSSACSCSRRCSAAASPRASTSVCCSTTRPSTACRPYVDASQLGSNFLIQADVKQGVDEAKVEAAIDEELKRLHRRRPDRGRTRTGPHRVQGRLRARHRTHRRLRRQGRRARRMRGLHRQPRLLPRQPEDHRDRVGRRHPGGRQGWLAQGDHVLVVQPGARKDLPEDPAGTPAPFDLPKADPKYTTTASTVDRSKGVPITDDFPSLKFPALQRATLSNGTKVILAERHDMPVVQMSYMFGGGYAADHGREARHLELRDGHARRRRRRPRRARVRQPRRSAGRQPRRVGVARRRTRVSVGAEGKARSVARPVRRHAAQAAFRPEGNRSRRARRGSRASSRRRRKPAGRRDARAAAAAVRRRPSLRDSRSAAPATKRRSPSLTRDDLVAFHHAWVRPDNATLVIVGDTTLAEITPLLEKHLGDWKVDGSAPKLVALAPVALPKQPRVFLIDQPGAVQANLYVGQVMPSSKDAGATKLEFANAVLGGEFSSRLNMNLREDKHWAYGSYSMASERAGPAPVDGVRAGADRQDRRIARRVAPRDHRVRRRQGTAEGRTK